MNGVAQNSNKKSPKTPGGISKSLLTPCRRVGLSRKWRKGGCSPFISPLSAHNTSPEKTTVRAEKKRKQCDENDIMEINKESETQLNSFHDSNECSPTSCYNSNENNHITSTPCRTTQISRKKSKVLSLSSNTSQETQYEEPASAKQLQPNMFSNVGKSKTNDVNIIEDKIINQEDPVRQTPEEDVSKLTRTISKTKKLSLKKSLSKESYTKESKLKDTIHNPKHKQISPNKLTKECIVVIQNKILKIDSHIIDNEAGKSLQESDSEPDISLSDLKKESNKSVILNTLDDDDFISKPVEKKFRKLSTIKTNKTTPNCTESSDTSQSSQEGSDKRTILIKKSYEKVVKPQKAKSTGSITQKDIDDLKARIEMKKKLLLAKAMSIDTEELRGLIKKWQKGCQDALMELLDLMKKKLPDRQNMDYTEILKTLKIPNELVGYDPENDCFISPDDTNVLLSAFKL